MADSRRGSNPIWFERLSRGPSAALCLFCFPYAGGAAQVFRSWRQYLPQEVDLCLVHLPGRAARLAERPVTRLSVLVDAIAAHIGDEIRHPFAFYGHSMGALISFELAREARRRYGIEPAELFVSGRIAPHVTSTEPAIFNLPSDELIGKLRELNGTPQEVFENTELAEIFLPILRADFELVDTYEYRAEARLSCPITVYGGLEDKRVRVEDLRAWKEQTEAAFKIKFFPGDHFFIHSLKMQFLEALQLDLTDSLRNLAV
jgi:medium-chain acyl-[acyl-carrier-protein] hydrolase